MIHKKLLSLLVLLMTAASGAWADYTVTWKGNTLKGIAVNKAYAIPISAPSETTVKGITLTANVGFFFYRSTGANPSVNLTSGAPDGLVFSAETNIKSIEFTFNESGCFNGTVAATPGTGGYTLTTPAKSFGIPRNDWAYDITKVVFTLEGEDPNPNEVDLDFNNAMTEAEFEMPASDVTIDYELVRDMSVQMPVTVGDGQDGYRIRLKMEDEAYVLAEMQPEEARALINVHDAIENKNLVFAGDGAVCTVDIYAVDEEDKATGDAIAFADLTPGRYVAIATAADGTAYDGQTAQSNVFELYEGFPVVVPATEEEGGEVDLGTVSFYTEQFNLKLETGSSAKLYTLTAIDGHTVTATEVDVVPAGMPFFVLNETDAEQMVTLLPATAEEVTPTPTPIIEFLGTDVDLTFTQEDMDGAYDYYILHRGIFVWVKDPGTLKAGKCYLRILKGQPTTARRIVFSEATGLRAIENGKLTIENEAGAVYDLSGRRVAAPTKKGVYIQNGKKVMK